MRQQRLVYPTERLVGTAGDTEMVDAVVDALHEDGVDDERIEILAGGADEFREDPDERSWAGRVAHVLKTSLGDETERLGALRQALDAGRLVVQVRLTEEEDDDREEAKQRLGRLMSDHGLQDVAFYGKWQIEEIQLGA